MSDIIKQLNYIIENAEQDNNIINYCKEQIEKFSHDENDFVNEYTQFQNKLLLSAMFKDSVAKNKIKLPKLTPQEINRTNDMTQLRRQIDTLYNEIHINAINKTKEYILKIINQNNSAFEIFEFLVNNEDKIVRNNFQECLNQHIKDDDFQETKNKLLLKELRELLNG